ncbi:tetratricopeptide repeat protein [Desulforhopalus singaporensis]|nr:tetratricopeptide repeat protein [Desulforhopalus singaporensis]
MISLRRRITVSCLLLFLLPVHASFSGAAEEIGPKRNISVISSSPDTPDWKYYWDLARQLAADEKYEQAGRIYGEMFKIKNNIEEANWEYCKVLEKTGDLERIQPVLESLMELGPKKIDYQLMAGRVAFKKKDYSAAVERFGAVFATDPAGELGEQALEGMVYALRAGGQKRLAFPLLEQLAVRKPDDPVIDRDLAFDSAELGFTAKAGYFFRRLLADENVGDAVLVQAAALFRKTGAEPELVAVLTRYIKRHPDVEVFRKELVELLEKQGDYEAVFGHLLYLSDNAPEPGSYLLRGGDIALNRLDRPDKALGLYERYLELHPDQHKVAEKIATIREDLANELVVLVENGAGDFLWDDLSRITGKRESIFVKIASNLEKRKKYPELLVVLNLLRTTSSEKDGITLRIAKLNFLLKQYGQTLTELQKITKNGWTGEYYGLKAESQLAIGQETSALESFSRLLAKDRDDQKVRMRCVELAGKLGLAGDQQAFFDYFLHNENSAVSGDSILTHVRLLGYNYLVSEALKVIAWAEKGNRLSARNRIALEIEKARIYYRVGNKQRGETVLRTLLNEGRTIDLVMFELAELAIVSRRYDDADKWLFSLARHGYASGFYYPESVYNIRLHLMRGKLFRMRFMYERAIKELQLAEALRADAMEEAGHYLGLQKDIDIERFYRFFLTRNYDKANEQLQTSLKRSGFDPDMAMLQQLLNEKVVNNNALPSADLGGQLYSGPNPIVSRMLALVEREIGFLKYQQAGVYLQTVLEKVPGSLLATVLKSELLAAYGKTENALNNLAKIPGKYRQDDYFCRERIELALQGGQYEQAITTLEQCRLAGPSDHHLAERLLENGDVEGALMLSRILWAGGNYDSAVELYEKMLSPTISELLRKQFSREKVNLEELVPERGVWSSLSQLLDSEPEIVDEIMEPGFLVNNLGTKTGEIVAEQFEKYKYHWLIANEYNARKAIFARNYRFAAQSYKRLLQEESRREAMVDLASIYDRMGEYRKEAQVYEKMKSSGIDISGYEKTIERSAQKISPQNIIETNYLESEGRAGFKDMESLSVGTLFTFSGELDKEFALGYHHNRYDARDGENGLDTNDFSISSIFEITDNNELAAGFGFEKISDQNDSFLLTDIRFKSQFDDHVSGFVQYVQQPITDTVVSLRDELYTKSFITGLGLDTSFGMQFGGDFKYSLYSDDNRQNRVHGYSVYSLYTEAMQVDFRYDYTWLENQDTNPVVLAPEEASPATVVTSYWSPEQYTEHRLGLFFKHNFLGYEKGGDRKMSYYSVDGAVSVEDDNKFVYSTKFDIFLEMSPHFLLKGNFNYMNGDNYRETGMSLGLHYRW